MWKVGDEMVIVQRGLDDVPCVVEKVYHDGSCVAGGRRWNRHGWEYGRHTYASLAYAAKRQHNIAYRERTAVMDRISARLRTMTTDELRAVLASLEVSDDR